jgi:ubiquinone/menaquinone biosynthesis C-methylase UbiE
MQTYHHTFVKSLNSLCPIEGKSVLVIGCSKGLECDIIRQYNASLVTGLDISSQTGRDYKDSAISYSQASAEQIPYVDNSFDICFSTATLEHISNPQIAMEEMVRVTKKYGTIYCHAAPLWNSPYGHHKRNIFPTDPWIHLICKDANEMNRYYGDRYDETIDGKSFAQHVNYVYSKAFNRKGAKEYKKYISDILIKTSPVRISFAIDTQLINLITPQLESKLHDYDTEELITTSLVFVLIKT